MDAPRSLRLAAPAKVNLYLEVRGRRPDGYHELRMFLAPVSLADDLELERLDEAGRIEVSCAGDPHAPGGESNLCHRAARYYFEATGVRGGVRVRVTKRIPVGAGLGGGSSDAATTLLGLERLFGTPLSAAARAAAAFRVGADVPFFFAQGSAWVGGIGEVVEPVAPHDPLWLVIVHPGTFLATAEVFSRLTLGLTTQGRPHTITQFNFRGFLEGLRNDLQEAAVALAPQVGQALTALVWADAPGVLMTGSGSAVLGLFPDEGAARGAATRLQGDGRSPGWRIEVVHTLPMGARPPLEGDPDWGVDKR